MADYLEQAKYLVDSFEIERAKVYALIGIGYELRTLNGHLAAQKVEAPIKPPTCPVHGVIVMDGGCPVCQAERK